MEIRRSQDRLISTVGFAILVRWHLDIESGPRPRPSAPMILSMRNGDKHFFLAQIIPNKLSQYHVYWCPGSWRHQAISSHDIDSSWRVNLNTLWHFNHIFQGSGLDWICLTTTHVLQDKLAVLFFFFFHIWLTTSMRLSTRGTVSASPSSVLCLKIKTKAINLNFSLHNHFNQWHNVRMNTQKCIFKKNAQCLIE